ncbi:MAG: ABC transporter permease [Planctomycetota bacterium]|jgi:ribose transport system permease protein
MKKNLGILSLFLVVFIATAVANPTFVNAYNMENLITRASLYGIIGIGVAFVIVTGGIDLSIGSVIGLVGTTLPLLLIGHEVSPVVALPVVFALVVAIGLAHGALITKLNLQPFVVTLCGLLIYRGAARGIAGDATQGFQGKFEWITWLANGKIPLIGKFDLPVPFIILMILAAAAAVFLNKTIYGRYLLALGNNELGARYSGIETKKMIIVAYVICSVIAGFGGILFAAYSGSVQPDNFGSFYELYAIAAAVLGGCSLRGGQGSIFGVLIGAAILPLIRNSINLLGMDTTLEFAIIGVVILVGVITDEVVKRVAAKRRAILQARQAAG